MFIHWDSTLETGQPLVDSEHRMLIMLFRKFDVGIKTHQPDDVMKQIVLELRQFVHFHFVSEENLMLETHYPRIAGHRALHADLLTELDIFVAKVLSHRAFAEEFLFFINQWLIEHIANHDQHLALHVRESADRPIAEFAYPEYLVTPRSGDQE